MAATLTATSASISTPVLPVVRAVAVAALTVYDMCKAVDKTMEIGGVRLISKKGGKSDFSVAGKP